MLQLGPMLDKPGVIGSMNWHLTLCLLLSWIIVFFCLMKGVKSSGKVWCGAYSRPALKQRRRPINAPKRGGSGALRRRAVWIFFTTHTYILYSRYTYFMSPGRCCAPWQMCYANVLGRNQLIFMHYAALPCSAFFLYRSRQRVWCVPLLLSGLNRWLEIMNVIFPIAGCVRDCNYSIYFPDCYPRLRMHTGWCHRRNQIFLHPRVEQAFGYYCKKYTSCHAWKRLAKPIQILNAYNLHIA